MRAFIAIELDAPAREALGALLVLLQNARSPVRLRWVKPESQHLTLYFFQDVAPARVDDVARALDEAVPGIAPVDLTFSAVGCFPNVHKPNVLWLGVQEPSGALARLHTTLNTALSRLGFEPEARAFTPHLTLARVPRQVNPRERKALGEWFLRQPAPSPHDMRVAQVHFIQSELLPAGPKYTTLHVARLAGNAVNG
jgi:2'-5' RNA ligase